jgi:hypothetical protein
LIPQKDTYRLQTVVLHWNLRGSFQVGKIGWYAPIAAKNLPFPWWIFQVKSL